MDKPNAQKKSQFEFLTEDLSEHGDFTKLSPLAPKYMDFDWELLRRHLGESEKEMGAADYALMGDALGVLLRWIVRGDRLDIIGRRAVALAWVVNPDIFHGMSAAALARKSGCSHFGLNENTADASRVTGLRNRSQDHAWNFKRKVGRPVGK
jgi:hypothetical protein